MRLRPFFVMIFADHQVDCMSCETFILLPK